MSNIFKDVTDSDLQSPSNLNPLAGKKASAGLLGVKIAIAGSFLLSIAALGGAAYLYQSLNTEIRQRHALEASQVQYQEKAENMEEQVKQYKNELERVSEQLKTYATERKDYQQQLEEVRAQLEKKQEEAAPVPVVQPVFNQAADTAADTNAEQAQAPSQQAAPAAEEPVAAPPAAAAVPAEAPAEAPAAAEPAPAAEEKPAAAAPSKGAQVMTVNRKFNFVVVNRGSKDNLNIGDVLILAHDGKNIGKAKVEKLYDTFAAATIVEESKNSPIQQGDTVQPA